MSNSILDMSLGNPEFLLPYWEKEFPLISLMITEDANYQYTSLKSLKDNIKLLHKKLDNANVDNRTIVIGNGVTQLLNGLLNISDNPLVYAEPPHYHRFPELARINGQTWIDDDSSLKIETVPSNPIGIYGGALNCKSDTIFDLNYNWPQYCVDLNYAPNFDLDIVVFGASKALGLASARIGWAIIKNKELAQKLEKYVEFTTGGVSIYSQKIVNELIKKQLVLQDTVFKYGKEVLLSRWTDVRKLKSNLPFIVKNSNGMFLWCEGKCPENLKGFPGTMFGDFPNHFRLSLGVSEEKWLLFKELYAVK